MPENAQSLPQIKLLTNHRRRIDLHAVESKLLFLLGQELRSGCTIWQVPKCKNRKEEGATALNDE